MPVRSGGRENPFRSARTTKNQECFSLKLEVEGISFTSAISHKLFLSFSFCHTDTCIINSNSNIQENFEKSNQDGEEEEESNTYFPYLSTQASSSFLIPCRGRSCTCSCFQGKEPKSQKPLPCNIQAIYKLSLSEFFIRGEGNNTQRVLRSQRSEKVKGERHVYGAHATHREGQDTEAWRHRCSVEEGSKASSGFNSAMK